MLASVTLRTFSSSRLLREVVKLKTVCASDGFETWFLTLREGYTTRIFESAVQRKIFGSEREEETGGCSRLLNEDRYNLQSSYNISKGDETKEGEMYGACGMHASEVHAGFWWDEHEGVGDGE